MSAPVLQSDTIPEVGRFYMVPCARAMARNAMGRWVPMQNHRLARTASGGWLPVIGEVHEDREVIGFEPDHIHIDVRFVSLGPADPVEAMARPLTGLDFWSVQAQVRRTRFEFSRRRMLCKRPGQLFPKAPWLPKLEQAHVGCRLSADGLCPHRGIPVAAGHQLPDGSMVCPGHGLRWGQDGLLLRRRKP